MGWAANNLTSQVGHITYQEQGYVSCAFAQLHLPSHQEIEVPVSLGWIQVALGVETPDGMLN